MLLHYVYKAFFSLWNPESVLFKRWNFAEIIKLKKVSSPIPVLVIYSSRLRFGVYTNKKYSGMNANDTVSGHERASHSSFYFTAENMTNCEPKEVKRSKKKSKRVKVHISRDRNTRIPSSTDSNEPEEHLPIGVYNPVKRSCSQDSAGRYAPQLVKNLEEDRKCCTKIHLSSSKLSKSSRKCPPTRKKVYRPFLNTKDTSLQTDCASKFNKECQADSEIQRVCCKGVECDLLKVHEYSTKECRTDLEKNFNCHHSHTFPFVGESPSGNLKVSPEMVSFENQTIGVLLSDPKKTKLTHNKWTKTNSIDSEVHKHKNPQGPLWAKESKCQVPHNLLNKPRGGLFPGHKFSQTSCIQIPNANNTFGNNKAPCHKERPFQDTNKSLKHPPTVDYAYNKRNYSEEMKAWQSLYPMFKKTDEYSKDQIGFDAFETEINQQEELKENCRINQCEKHYENENNYLRNSSQDIFKDLKPSPPPRVPPFPRETSPASLSSTVPKSQVCSTDNDEFSHQLHNSNDKKRKGNRGTLDFMENLHYRVKRAIHPDTKVVIGNMEFPLHSVALQIHSKYFDNLRRPQDTVHRIELPESIISPDDFQHVMDWVLTNERDRKLILTRDNVVGLYATAQYLAIHELKSQCLKFVQEKVDSEDPKLIKLWEEAHIKPKTKELIAVLSQKLTKLFPKLYKTRQFLKLDVNELVTLLDSDEVVIESEMDIFDAAVRWLLYDWQNRKRHTVKIMSTVRFGLLTPLQLTQMRFLSEDKETPDFKKIFSFDCVKTMLEDGKTYAVLKQSYDKRPGELNKWVKNTCVTPPRPRIHLDHELENLQRMPDPLVALNDAIGEIGKGATHLNLEDLRDKTKNIFDALNPQRGQKTSQQEAKLGDSDHMSPAQQSLLLLQEIPNENLDNQDSGSYIGADQKNNEIHAAVTIQRFSRGFLARKKVETMKHAAHVIQDALKTFHKKSKNHNTNEERKTSLTPRISEALQPNLLKNLDLPKDALLIFGGADPKNVINPDNTGQEIFMYTVDANRWINVGRMPEPRTHFGVARINNDVYVVGGTDPRFKTSNDRNIGVKSVWKVNLRNGEWEYDSNLPKDLANSRSHFGCIAKNGIIYVIGGNDMDSRALSTCEKYDEANNSWTPIASLDGPRLSMGTALYENHIWVAGGTSKNPRMPVLKSVLCYDIGSNSWTEMKSLPLPRGFSSLLTAQGKLYLVGGAGQRDRKSKQQTSVPDVLVYDEAREKWREIGLLRTARHGHVCAAIGKTIIVVGGVNSGQMGAINSVEIFDLTSKHSRKGRSLSQKMAGMGILQLM